MGYTPPVPGLLPQPDGTFSVRGWKVCVPGYWRGELFSPARIAGIVATYRLLKGLLGSRFTPKVRIGHDPKQRLAASLGLPNAGRVTDLRPTPDGGMEIDTDGTPQKVLAWNPASGRAETFDLLQAFRNRNYDGGSIELTRAMSHPTDPRRKLFDVFDGIALLGEEHPAMRTADGIPTTGCDATLTLAFSAYAEEPPMTPKQQLAQLMGVDETDPSIAAMDDATCAKLLALVQGGGNPNPAPPAPPPGPPIAMSAEFQAMQTRLNAMEAAHGDLKKQLFAGGGAGVVTMSEAHRRIDECVKAGKVGVTKALADAIHKPTATALLNLPADKMTFSDGDHKGKSQIAVFLEEMEARPVDMMFSEQVDDTGTGAVTADGLPQLDDEDMAILRTSNDGRAALNFYRTKVTAGK